MAVTRSCDGKCGGKNPALGQIHVDVWAENVAGPEMNTGKRITRDSCGKCRASLMEEMFREGVKGLELDIPRHKAAIEAKAEEAAADQEIARLRRLQLADDADAPAGLPGNRAGAIGNQPAKSIGARIKQLEAIAAKAAARRDAALSEGPVTEG